MVLELKDWRFEIDREATQKKPGRMPQITAAVPIAGIITTQFPRLIRN